MSCTAAVASYNVLNVASPAAVFDQRVRVHVPAPLPIMLLHPPRDRLNKLDLLPPVSQRIYAMGDIGL